MDYFVLRFDHSYRKEDFRALSKLAGKTTRKWSSRIISVFGFAVGLFAFLSGILMLWSDREISDLTATLLLFGGLCLVLGFFRNRLNAWGARKQSLQVENLTMKFSDEGAGAEQQQGRGIGAVSCVRALVSLSGPLFPLCGQAARLYPAGGSLCGRRQCGLPRVHRGQDRQNGGIYLSRKSKR